MIDGAKLSMTTNVELSPRVLVLKRVEEAIKQLTRQKGSCTGIIDQLVIRTNSVRILKDEVDITHMGIAGDKHLGKKKDNEAITDDEWSAILRVEAVSLIDSKIAEAIGRLGISGDNLIVTDLDFAQVQPGSLMVIHTENGVVRAILAPTIYPHLGCAKFSGRVGVEAAARIFYGQQNVPFHLQKELDSFKEEVRANLDAGLRGRKAAVIVEGHVHRGDRITIIQRSQISSHPLLVNTDLAHIKLALETALFDAARICDFAFEKKRKFAVAYGKSPFNPDSTTVIKENEIHLPENNPFVFIDLNMPLFAQCSGNNFATNPRDQF